jgi:tetratricopeptide (TPR) repeat protein
MNLPLQDHPLSQTNAQPVVNKKIITAGSRRFVLTMSYRHGEHDQADAPDIPALLARVSADATDHQALFQLGLAYRRLDRFTDSVDAFSRAIAIHAEEAAYHLQLGRSCLALQQFTEALSHCREALRLDPQNAGALVASGLACKELNLPNQALGHFHAALKIDPALVRAYVGVGQTYSQMGWHDKALRCLERAERLLPDNAWIQTEIGHALEQAERFEEAIARFERAIALDDTYAAAHASLSTTLVVMGRLPEAMVHARRAVDLWSGALAHLINSLVQTGQPVPAEIITQAETILADTNEREPRVREPLLYAMARYYDRAADYGRAMALLGEGGRLVRQRQRSPYSADQAERAVDRIIEVFSKKNIRRLSAGGIFDNTPIFVLGMMRSGTTLVEQILSSHPLVHGAGELPFLRNLCANFDARLGRAFPENFLEMSKEVSGFLGRQYLLRLRALAPEAERIVDKMPANYELIGAIKCLLPKATIIHCRRNPLDTCLSNFQQLFAAPHPATYDLTDLGRFYCGYSRLMEHWRRLFGESIHEVVYEELIANPEAEARRLLAASGLPYDEACLSFFRQERPVRTASYFQVRRPLHRESVGKWQRYQPYIEELIHALAPCLEDKG